MKQQIQIQKDSQNEALEHFNVNPTEYTQVEAQIEAQKNLEIIGSEDDNSQKSYYLGLVVAILLFLTIQLTGGIISTGIVEEKSNRVVEIILGTMNSFEVLLGKILGIGLLGLLQIGLIAGSALSANAIFNGNNLFDDVPIDQAIPIFIGFYIFGYLGYAALFAAFASTVTRTEEVNQAIAPVQMFLMVPYFAICIPGLLSNQVFTNIITYCPLANSLAVPALYVQNLVTTKEALISLAISVLTIPIILIIASHIYNKSILQTGGKVKLSTIFKK
jgi:ABC-2 type transport system permease protein